MKISRYSRWLVVMLLFALVFVSACGSGGSKSSNGDAQPSGSGSSSGTQTGGEQQSEQVVEREHLEIKMYLNAAADAVLPKGDDDFVRKTIEEKFNVTLDMHYDPYNDESKQKLNLMIASNNAPDIFTTPGANTIELAQAGALMDLQDILTPEKIPNLYNWLTPEQVKGFQLVGYDGWFRAPVADNSFAYYSYFIRKDWLDNLGLNIPTNYEELTEVMRAFTYDDPDGNNKNDTYGFSVNGNGTMINYAYPQFKHHGLFATYIIDEETREFRTQFTDPVVANVMEEIIDWHEKGYVDPDSFLSTADDVAVKFAQGRIGMVWVLNVEQWAYDSEPNSFYNQLKKIVPEAEMVPFNPFPDTPNWTVGTPPSKAWMIHKNVSPEKVERIIEILDWLMSEEGFLLTHYGLEGKHYTRNGNEITLIPDAIKADIVDKGNFLTVWDDFTPKDPRKLGLTVNDPRLTERDQEILRTIESYKVGEGLSVNVSPPEGFNWGDFSKQRYVIQVKTVFEDKHAGNWMEYVTDFSRNYGANELFSYYVKQLQDAGIDVKDYKEL